MFVVASFFHEFDDVDDVKIFLMLSLTHWLACYDDLYIPGLLLVATNCEGKNSKNFWTDFATT